MRRISLRTLALLLCIVATNCGGSDPTSPDSPPPSGGGGGGTGGGGSFGRTAVTSDAGFDDGQWADVVETFGAGGDGGGGRLSFMGQEGAHYRQVTVTVNNAGSGSGAQVAVFAFKQGAVYFPATDGAILWIDHSEDSIHQQGGTDQYQRTCNQAERQALHARPWRRRLRGLSTRVDAYQADQSEAERLPYNRISCRPSGLLC